jgi:hypothetical protein
MGYAGIHKYGTYKDDACKEFHEIDSWNLVGGTSKMYATIIQGIGVRSILDYASDSGMARTHFLKLERLQYRG